VLIAIAIAIAIEIEIEPSGNRTRHTWPPTPHENRLSSETFGAPKNLGARG